jgi:hypothetical protein
MRKYAYPAARWPTDPIVFAGQDACETAHCLSAAVSIAVVHLTGNFQVSGN